MSLSGIRWGRGGPTPKQLEWWIEHGPSTEDQKAKFRAWRAAQAALREAFRGL
ncbi:MAG: hypothetical protein LBE98_00745 [Puniceicoccales bacterium]|jgi:hypothetical protein|nr:hypothetical protein [Puniceicoccales bacterium]